MTDSVSESNVFLSISHPPSPPSAECFSATVNSASSDHPSDSASTKKRGRPAASADEDELGHPVHQMFTFDENGGQFICTVCRTAGKDAGKLPGKHAGNFMSHFKTHHKELHEKLRIEWAKRCVARRSGKKAKVAGTKTLNGVRMSGAELKLHSLRLITENGLSFKVLDYPAFQDIIRPLRNAMPPKEGGPINSHTIPPKIHALAEHVRAKLTHEMEDKMVSLMVDGCSKGHRCFIGINLQYTIDEKIVVRTLAVEEVSMHHSATNLKTVIMNVLKKYEVSIKRLVSFTSDNGENYILAGKLLAKEEVELLLEGCCSVDWGLLESTELTQDDYTIQSIRCAEHTLQLAIDDALKSNDANLKKMLGSVRELSKFLRTQINSDQIKSAGLSLPSLDVVTRWGSTYDMVVSIQSLRQFMQRTMTVSIANREKYFLTDEEWEMSEDFVNTFKAARRATVQLQEENLSLGKFLAVWTQCKMRTAKSKTDLGRALVTAMDERSKPLLYRSGPRGRRGEERLSSLFNYPSFNAAVFMDPRYVSLLSPDEIANAKNYLCILWQRIQLLAGPVMEESEDTTDDPYAYALSSDSSSDDESFSKLLQRKNRERRLSRIGAAASGSSSGTALNRNKIKSLLDDYDNAAEVLPETADVHEYWFKNRLVSSELYALASVVLAIPATQVSVERLFSSLRFILRPQRFNLSSVNVDDITFLHANKDLVKALLTSPQDLETFL